MAMTYDILDKMCNSSKIKNITFIDKNEFNKIKNNKDYHLPYNITDILLSDINLCDNYKSDLLVSINNLREELIDLIKNPTSTPKLLMLGYRKNGVDGNTLFLSNIDTWGKQLNYDMAANYYRRNYIIEIGIINDNFKYTEQYSNAPKYLKDDIYMVVHDVTNNISLY